MDRCCEVRAVPREQRRILGVVLGINVGMFVVEAGAGLLARSTALLADSGDMLGDAIVYGFSLYVVARGPIWQARGALLKGVLMAGLGVGVLAEAMAKALRGTLPTPEVMGIVGLLALAANGVCLWLLSRRRGDDINMRSAWLCSRNDVVTNAGVLAATAGVVATGSMWPDVLVGLGIAALLTGSAVGVLREACWSLRPDAHVR